MASPHQLWNDGRAVIRARWFLRHATELGPKVRVWGHPVISNQGTLKVGARCRLVSTISTLEIVVGPEGTLEIGEGSFINHGGSIAATKLVRIGAGANIGPDVLIMDNDFHRLEPERRHELPPSAPIVLEPNVWIGARAIILRGVTVGEGSVIGAMSVVAHDVPPRSVVAGNPAKVVRKL